MLLGALFGAIFLEARRIAASGSGVDGHREDGPLSSSLNSIPTFEQYCNLLPAETSPPGTPKIAKSSAIPIPSTNNGLYSGCTSRCNTLTQSDLSQLGSSYSSSVVTNQNHSSYDKGIFTIGSLNSFTQYLQFPQFPGDFDLNWTSSPSDHQTDDSGYRKTSIGSDEPTIEKPLSELQSQQQQQQQEEDEGVMQEASDPTSATLRAASSPRPSSLLNPKESHGREEKRSGKDGKSSNPTKSVKAKKKRDKNNHEMPPKSKHVYAEKNGNRHAHLEHFIGFRTNNSNSENDAEVASGKTSTAGTTLSGSFTLNGGGRGLRKGAHISALTQALSGNSFEITSDLHDPANMGSPKAMPSSYSSGMPFEEWSKLCRLPSAMSSLNSGNAYPYPYCQESDPVFVKQLKKFRNSLQTLPDGERLPLRDYVPFPESSKDWSNQSPFRPVHVLPKKIFESQPVINWIPVECKALGYEFEVISTADGRELYSGKKCCVQIVKSGRKKFVRKIFNSVDILMHEVEFFRIAHHHYLPIPVCVEYKYPAIVMEYIEGQRIHDAMHNYLLGTFNEKRDLKLALSETWDLMSKCMAKLMTVIRYIHSIGFIHRDIKPDNVLYDFRTGRLVLIDFDLSSHAPFVTSNRGTSSTVAPEVTGFLKGPVHFAADWWGFGSTVAIVAANVIAAQLQLTGAEPSVVREYMHYAPFCYSYRQMKYTMQPIPPEMPVNIRAFLFPLFSPNPAHREFSDPDAFDWLTNMSFLSSIEDFSALSRVTFKPSLVMALLKSRDNPIIVGKKPHVEMAQEDKDNFFARVAARLNHEQFANLNQVADASKNNAAEEQSAVPDESELNQVADDSENNVEEQQ